MKWIDLPPARSLEFWWPSLESEKFRVGARVRSGQGDHETVIWSPWIDGAAIGGAK